MRTFIWIFIFSLIFSCSSAKKLTRDCKKQTFEKLDSSYIAPVNLNYKITLRSDWIKSKAAFGDWYYIKDKFVDSLGYDLRKADLYVHLNKVKKECIKEKISLEDYLKFFIDYKNKFYRNNFKYKLIEAKHKIYNKIYIINYKEKFSNSNIKNRTVFLIYSNNKGYRLEYVSNQNEYKKFLPEIENIISSFRILDN